MSENNLKNILSQRLGGPNFGEQRDGYKFARIKIAKKRSQIERPGFKILDFGVGEPDEMADSLVVDTLGLEARKKNNRGYADNGCEEFLVAASSYMYNKFGVCVDADSEIMHSIGSKSALAMLAGCFIDPGDYAIVTIPGYPVFAQHVKYYGGLLCELPLLSSNNFLPKLSDISEEVLKKTKVLLINYPNNPTAAIASRGFFEEVISFAKRHNIVIINDAAYASIVYGKPYLSILQVEGAMDVAIELHSLSKSFNMTGWRMGWVCGNKKLVSAYATIKENTDSGQFLAIQKAAAVALSSPHFTERLCKKYSRRLQLLSELLSEFGFDTTPSLGTFFLYVKSPSRVESELESIEFTSAEDFSQWLILREHVCVVPWDEAGHYLRFSVTYNASDEEEERNVMHELYGRLKKYRFYFFTN